MSTNNIDIMRAPLRNELRIVGAHIRPNRKSNDGGPTVKRWRNFAGDPTPVNPAGGKRFFTIDLNRCGRIEWGNWRDGYVEKTVEELIAEGWRIKMYDAREEYPESTPNANLEIIVSFHNNPLDQWKDPKILQHSADGTEIALDQYLVGGLDNAWIEDARVKLALSKNNKPYLNVLEVFLKEASFNNPYSWD